VELGKNDTGNTNTNVGARQGVVDDVFTRNATGEFQLGADSDIANGELRYRYQEARKFRNLVGDYHCPPAFMEKVSGHLVKNFLFGGGLRHLRAMRNKDGAVVQPPNTPLILGVWGGKGCGKSFNLELACKAMGVTPIITSAGELEDENAGAPGRLIRERYKRAGEIVRRTGVMSCLIINDVDAGIGWFKDTQHTVNNQTVCGTLMNLCDHPELVSLGEDRGEDGKNLQTARVPIIITANDLSTVYAPLLRDGRMDKWYWNPNRDDICDIVHALFKDEVDWSPDATARLVDAFPGQPLDFFGAARAKVYDDAVLRWMREVSVRERCEFLVQKMSLGGEEDLFGNVGDDSSLWRYYTPKDVVRGASISLESVFEAATELAQQQQYMMAQKLSIEYMKWQKNPEDLTDEERQAMEAKDNWRRTMQRREEARRARVAEMRTDKASPESIEARRLLLEATMKRAREQHELKLTERQLKVTSKGVNETPILAPPNSKRWIVVSVEEAFKAFKAGECSVIDVRDVKSWRRESVSGALNIPLVSVEGKPLAYTYNTNAREFLETFTSKFPNKDEAVVLLGGSQIEANGLDDPERCGCMDALIDRGYDSVVVVDGGYDGWVREYTPGGKKRLQEWKLDVVVSASGTSCVGAELPVVGSLAEERHVAKIAHLKALEEQLASKNANSANSAWKVAFDKNDRLYFYDSESEKSQWADPSAYDVTNQIWLLSAPMSDSGAIALTAISVDDAVQRLLSKSSMVIDVRNPYAFNMESVNGVINVPLRRAEGSKLSPTYAIVGKDAFAQALASIAADKAQSLIFVGDESPDERSEIAAQHALSAGYTDVLIVVDSVPQWLKKYTASGKPKKVLAQGAYKSDLLSKGAFNMFAGES
jgi:rhodanese-related sulfurtransferase